MFTTSSSPCSTVFFSSHRWALGVLLPGWLGCPAYDEPAPSLRPWPAARLMPAPLSLQVILSIVLREEGLVASQSQPRRSILKEHGRQVTLSHSPCSHPALAHTLPLNPLLPPQDGRPRRDAGLLRHIPRPLARLWTRRSHWHFGNTTGLQIIFLSLFHVNGHICPPFPSSFFFFLPASHIELYPTPPLLVRQAYLIALLAIYCAVYAAVGCYFLAMARRLSLPLAAYLRARGAEGLGGSPQVLERV